MFMKCVVRKNIVLASNVARRKHKKFRLCPVIGCAKIVRGGSDEEVMCIFFIDSPYLFLELFVKY
jgi:hypothetical protein